MTTVALASRACTLARGRSRKSFVHKHSVQLHLQDLSRAAVPCVSYVPRRSGRCAAAQGFAPPEETGSIKKLAKKERQVVVDKLIAALQSKPQSEWRKLITYSKQWPSLCDEVFARLNEVIKVEKDPERKLKLRRFLRGLRNASDDIARFAAFYAKFEESDESEYEALVAGHTDVLMSPTFFDYLGNKARASFEDRDKQAQIIQTGNRIAAIHEAYVRAQFDESQLTEAQQKLTNLMKDLKSLDDADRKIDEMAQEGQLDSAFLLTCAKAYSGVKETDMVKDEVKDIMYHLYMKAKERASQEAPKEVRILKHLLSISDPAHRITELENAFKPGAELDTPNETYLSCEPRALLAMVDTVLHAYENQKGKTSLLGQTADLMEPSVIESMRDIQKLIQQKYMNEKFS